MKITRAVQVMSGNKFKVNVVKRQSFTGVRNAMIGNVRMVMPMYPIFWYVILGWVRQVSGRVYTEDWDGLG